MSSSFRAPQLEAAWVRGLERPPVRLPKNQRRSRFFGHGGGRRVHGLVSSQGKLGLRETAPATETGSQGVDHRGSPASFSDHGETENVPLQCPRCRNAFGLKDPRPGRYSTDCPSCKEKLLIAVPDDRSREPEVSLLSAQDEAILLTPTPGPDLSKTRADEAVSAPPRGVSLPSEKPARGRPRLISTAAVAVPRNQAERGVASESKGTDRVLGRIPAFVDGYRVIREIGRSSLGMVFLGNQLSCDRRVALKIVNREWARNPIFASRFIRDVSVAALFRHHNIVQILDFGESGGTLYVCMEYIEGRTFADFLRGGIRIEPDAATGCILQAARGLKYAHDHGMIHRDIKPENLFLADTGVVKVADLGLVLTPTAAELQASAGADASFGTAKDRVRPGPEKDSPQTVTEALGSPLFMAPEQTINAGTADARSDIYSLGCVFYNLLTGRPPFEGSSAVELIAKHQNEPLVPPEQINHRISRGLSDLILKMTAKRPSERIASFDAVISALEALQEIPSGGQVGLSEDDARKLSECVDRFNAAPTALTRARTLWGGASVCAVLTLLSLLGGHWFLAGGLLGLGVMTAIGIFAVRGMSSKTYLYCKSMEMICSGRLVDWLVGLAAVALVGMLLVVFHLLWAWLAFGILAVVAAIAFRTTIDQRLADERREPIATADQMIKGLRFIGLDEDSIQRLVCQHSGDRWEEFFETLFGYEAMRAARDRWGYSADGRRRKRFGTWRDPIVDWIAARHRALRAARELPIIQRIEEKALEAQGVNTLTARRRSKRVAEALVAMASDLRATTASGGGATESFAISRVLQSAAEKPEDVLAERGPEPRPSRAWPIVKSLFGPRPRFLAGAALVFGCLLWIDQNEIVTGAQVREAVTKVKQVATKAVQSNDVSVVRDLRAEHLIDKEAIARAKEAFQKGSRPLDLPLLPEFLARRFDGFNAGVGGLLLIVSAFFRSPRMNLFGTLAGLTTWLAPAFALSATGLGDLRLISMGAGAALLAAGIVLGRRPL